LKEINPELIIILTVEFGSVDAAIKACKIGADDYLSKPFGAEHLMFTIEKLKKLKN
jgi:DNA-binding NtrC family response regulator